jgi:hypothetical protein
MPNVETSTPSWMELASQPPLPLPPPPWAYHCVSPGVLHSTPPLPMMMWNGTRSKGGGEAEGERVFSSPGVVAAPLMPPPAK